MSYAQFVTEREQMDVLLTQGYEMTCIEESLDGATVSFQKEKDVKTLRIQTAEGRKYFSTKFVKGL